MGTLHEDKYIFDYMSLFFSWNEKYVRQNCRENQNTILCSITFFLYHAVYKIMWKNIAEQGRPQVTIWCVCIACWIPKARHTLRICNTY